MNGQWNDDGECISCGLRAVGPPDVQGKPDPCLGRIPGVIAACCGHGGTCPSYVTFANAPAGSTVSQHDTLTLRREAADEFFRLARKHGHRDGHHA